MAKLVSSVPRRKVEMGLRLLLSKRLLPLTPPGLALSRKNALFAGSDAGARHWAVANTLIATAKLNGVEPLAYLTDVLERIVSRRTKAHELHSLLPWNWRPADRTISTAPA